MSCVAYLGCTQSGDLGIQVPSIMWLNHLKHMTSRTAMVDGRENVDELYRYFYVQG